MALCKVIQSGYIPATGAINLSPAVSPPGFIFLWVFCYNIHTMKSFTSIIVLLVLGFGGLIYWASQNSSKETVLPDVSVGAVDRNSVMQVRSDDYVLGSASSSVVLVEFTDMECPACAAYHPLLKSVTDGFGDKIAFVQRHFPLIQIHPHAVFAARAVEAAGVQGKYHEMTGLLYANQGAWRTGDRSVENYISYAEQLGLDVDQFRKDVNSDTVAAKVETQRQEAIALGIDSTPSFFLNGEQISGMQSSEDFAKKINSILKQ